MKRIFSLLIGVLLTLSLTSCAIWQTADKNTISPTQLTDREKSLLSLTDNQCFVFDINVDESYNSVTVWEERYEYGKKVSEACNLSTGIVQNKKNMLFALISKSDDKNADWSIAASTDGSTASAKFTEAFSGSMTSKMTGMNNLKKIPITSNEIVLAYICYNDKNKGMASLSEEFFKNPAKNMKEIADYQLVFLLKCKFSKDDLKK
ncbi:MAG TPA: hypothetical protein VHO94_00400 [Oscillospiraceae bacterium]|nr:hypothetical protein [Oscillospiraceae bacterium]